jgi:hypothetical protein
MTPILLLTVIVAWRENIGKSHIYEEVDVVPCRVGMEIH